MDFLLAAAQEETWARSPSQNMVDDSKFQEAILGLQDALEAEVRSCADRQVARQELLLRRFFQRFGAANRASEDPKKLDGMTSPSNREKVPPEFHSEFSTGVVKSAGITSSPSLKMSAPVEQELQGLTPNFFAVRGTHDSAKDELGVGTRAGTLCPPTSASNNNCSNCSKHNNNNNKSPRGGAAAATTTNTEGRPRLNSGEGTSSVSFEGAVSRPPTMATTDTYASADSVKSDRLKKAVCIDKDRPSTEREERKRRVSLNSHQSMGHFDDVTLQEASIFSMAAFSNNAKRMSLAERAQAKLDAVWGMVEDAWYAPWLQKVVQGISWFERLTEPSRHGCLARLSKSTHFNSLCVITIALNSGFIAFSTDYELHHLGESPTWTMIGIEGAFMLFYTFEVIIQLLVHRWHFFCNVDARWNIFDVLLVIFSASELLVILMMAVNYEDSSKNPVNVSFLRILRVFKIAKVLRLFRTFRFFSELKLMLDCVLGSFMSLFWCLVLLIFVLYVFSLLLVQGLVQTYLDNFPGEVEAVELQNRFGTVSKTMLTLLQSTTNGLDWEETYTLLDKRGTLLSLGFIFYILFFVIAAWNIVTSTFVEKAMRLAQPDLEALVLEQNMKDLADGEELLNLFEDADHDRSAGISLAEFKSVAEHPIFRDYLRVRGIDINNAELFFEMMRCVSGDTEVDLRTLVNALLRMKGFATSIDLHSLSFATRIMGKRQRHFMKETHSHLRKLETLLHNLMYTVGTGVQQPDSMGPRINSLNSSDPPTNPPEPPRLPL